MSLIHNEKILIIDFGSQTTQLIARRLREIGVYCEIHPFDISNDAIQRFDANGIILSGGPASVHTSTGPRLNPFLLEQSVPVLGICYGMQVMVDHLGGQVQSGELSEFGHADLFHEMKSPLFQSSANAQSVWMSHGDHVSVLPKGFDVIASTPDILFAAVANHTRQWFGVQFHPEVSHTQDGHNILKAFVQDICGCACLWTCGNILEAAVKAIHDQVGSQRVLCALSGGVDSSVLAALLHKAIGDQLECVFVDNGLLRAGEVEEVETMFKDHFGINLHMVQASECFLEALQGVHDPEMKRKKIGETFIHVFEQEAKQLNGIPFLAQGTIYPDVIESAGADSGKADLIKSHHNVGGLPSDLSFTLIEPLRELFKDEVRRLGLALDLSHKMVYRHPFPGPGLGIRVLGEVKPEFLRLLRQADHIFISMLREANLYDKVSQAFAVFLPVKSVAVKGDARHYEYVIALRAVETIDFMTARWAHLPHDFLSAVSRRIINEVPEISRVTYDISDKPPATIEWE